MSLSLLEDEQKSNTQMSMYPVYLGTYSHLKLQFDILKHLKLLKFAFAL